jgi:integrase
LIRPFQQIAFALQRKVLKGIRTLHPAQERQARPLQLEQIAQVANWLDDAIAAATASGRKPEALLRTRDRALLLLGFWRGFRGDELTRLHVQHIDAVAGEGRSLPCLDHAGRPYRRTGVPCCRSMGKRQRYRIAHQQSGAFAA